MFLNLFSEGPKSRKSVKVKIMSNNEGSLPTISVILTTKNEESNIVNCLSSIKKQDYPPSKIEIIVVDNYSNDRTCEFARQFTDKVFLQGPERSTQRNFAVQKARGEFFVQVDADQSLSPGVISECVKKTTQFKKDHLSSSGNLILHVPEEIVGGEGWFFHVRKFEKSFFRGTPLDSARFIPTDVFRNVGGYDEGLIGGEDWDLDNRLRQECSVDVIDACMFHNEGALTLSKFLSKKIYYLGQYDQFMKKWRDHPLTSLRFGLYYRYIGVYTQQGKWKKIIRHPILFGGVLMVRFLVGVVFLYVIARPKLGAWS